MPLFVNQIMIDYHGMDKRDQEVTQLFKDGATKETTEHKNSIKKEMQRRQEKKDEEARKRNHAAEAQARRRERRRCLREKLRIGKLQELIVDMTETAPKIEYNTQVKVLDVREFHGNETPEVGICTIGGFVGELILAFNAIYQSIVANPANAEFKFTAETVEKFLSEILPDDYPENIALIRT